MNYDTSQFVNTKTASRILGLTPNTLRKLDKNKQIPTIRTDGNRRLYNVQQYIDSHSSFENLPQNKVSICYCRVSSTNQEDDLQRQITFMQQKYPSHTIISDIGSGLNYNRKGLKTILELAHCGKIKELVVTYKDRLSRFGFELFEFILKTQSNAKIMVLNQSFMSKEQELTEDLLQILHVFSARSHGSRKYKTKSSGKEKEEHRTSDEN